MNNFNTDFNMETSLYENTNTAKDTKMLKRKMTLDFGGPSSKVTKFSALLASPDLNMLKLASPELEKMIIQSNGMITTTPTPTQFICPKSVTEEQEAYARGFVDALAKLHHNTESMDSTTQNTITSSFSSAMSAINGDSTTSSSNTSLVPLTVMSVPHSSVIMDNKSSTSSHIPSTVNTHQLNSVIRGPTNDCVPTVKEEPQTVPCMGGTPPLSPLDMDTQEVMKLERKRARNRVAARKCRTRKLEKISRLEERVSELKGQNSELTQTASSLRDQVMQLKKQIMDHVNSGCQVMLTTDSNLV